MKYTQEFLARLYSAYFEAPVRVEPKDNGVIQHMGSHRITRNSVNYVPFNRCKLLLKSRLAISNEDAIELCKIVHKDELGQDKWDLRVSSQTGYTVRISRWLLQAGERYPLPDLLVMAADPAYNDYLRAKGYSVPFSGYNNGEFITIDPIDAGLAIDKTNTK